MSFEAAGLVALLVLIANGWAVVHIFASGASSLAKALWAGVVLLLPMGGLVLWLAAGPRAGQEMVV